MRHKINIAALLIIITFGVQGCGTLPNVKPFASSTAALATAAGAEYHSVANDVASLKTPRIPNESVPPGTGWRSERSADRWTRSLPTEVSARWVRRHERWDGRAVVAAAHQGGGSVTARLRNGSGCWNCTPEAV